MTGHSLGVVVHDHVTTPDPGRNLSVRDQLFVEEPTVADDEVSALQHRKRRLLRVDDERRPTPPRRQEPTRPTEVVDVTIARKDWHHQRKRHGATLKSGPNLIKVFFQRRLCCAKILRIFDWSNIVT